MVQRIVISLEQVNDRQITLTTAQHHYLERVLRLGAGDRFIAMDGQGHSWLAALTSTTPIAQAKILDSLNIQTELPVAVTLVAALPKGSGFDEVVRQCTELGVAEIVPVLSDRTLLQPSPQKLERWRRIAQEAAEQAERQIVPPVREPLSFAAHLETLPGREGHKFFCEARDTYPHLLLQLTACPLDLPILLAVGPEGGWTEAEIQQAIAAGYQPVSLGDRILRAVTAPLAAMAIVAAALEIQEKSQ